MGRVVIKGRRRIATAIGGALIGVFLAATPLLAGSAAAEDPVELIGTWFVLIHYKDDNQHPDRERWDERVWVFEKKGSRLKWREYSQPVFTDTSGRWDFSLGRKAKELHFWEPNAAQLDEIKAGLQVSERGVVSKSLSKADTGWRTRSRSGASSASLISFIKHWNVDDPEGLPVFQQKDVLGGEAAEDLDGTTRFSTQEVGSTGDELRGEYVRDGTRHGAFRMIRSSGTRDVEGSGLTQSERVKPNITGEVEAAP